MTPDFLSAQSGYTKADLQILDFISTHPDEFLLMNIGQLSKRLGLSDATVSRFARHMGFDDFKGLKNAILTQHKSNKTPAVKMARTIMRDDPYSLTGWMNYQQQCLEKTLEYLDENIFSSAVKSLLNARNIYIHAKSASSSIGKLLYFRLRRLGLSVHVLPSGGSEIWEGLSLAGRHDLVIMFSFSKVSKEGRAILDYEKKAEYQTMAFTSRLFVPADERADINLFVYRGEENEYHSMTAAVAVIDALAVAAAAESGERSAAHLTALHDLKKEYKNL